MHVQFAFERNDSIFSCFYFYFLFLFMTQIERNYSHPKFKGNRFNTHICQWKERKSGWLFFVQYFLGNEGNCIRRNVHFVRLYALFPRNVSTKLDIATLCPTKSVKKFDPLWIDWWKFYRAGGNFIEMLHFVLHYNPFVISASLQITSQSVEMS